VPAAADRSCAQTRMQKVLQNHKPYNQFQPNHLKTNQVPESMHVLHEWQPALMNERTACTNSMQRCACSDTTDRAA
jgi:hypothetical protein